ncbi:respiratory nitrate reductase subunit gamma [Williamwhitmania taraxaci]|uniref:nitrate reductase (quinone) n=1 Tax=Williamwhitmania taraxaci TaxID=1640674 RepID=A0A1G6KWZ5_9BACT|nr:respiratory nitrate reductase subunit gamma [Williamwhitmania taraxaci]SDC35311.1 nitrate reductase gamma subunit [Williamwhitmania taraxaci]
MDIFVNNLLFTYLPHIAMAIFWFGVITRIVKTSQSLQAESSQFLSKKGQRWGGNLFHYGIIMVFVGHFVGLFTPESLYHLIMTTATKRTLALTLGGIFGIAAVVGITILFIRRRRDVRLRINGKPQDILLLLLLLFEMLLGISSIFITATSSVENYAALGIWAQKVVTFQPDAGAIIAGHSIIYKLHIVTGLLIFMIFPYTKLMHMFVMPISYFLRSSYQLVRSGFRRL